MIYWKAGGHPSSVGMAVSFSVAETGSARSSSIGEKVHTGSNICGWLGCQLQLMWPVPDRRRNNTPERVFKPAGRAREDDHDHHPRRVRRAGVGHARMRRTVVITTPGFLAVPSLVARVVKDKEPGQQSSRKPIWGKRRLARRRKSNPRY
jgi:hypothetical protein